MKNILLISLISVLFNVGANAQSYINEWLAQQGTGGFLTTNNMCTDNSGNLYKVGHFSLSPDFDPTSGTNNISSNGASDIFIQKFDALGNLLWVKTVGGTGTDAGKDVAVDVLGNVYITGTFYDTVDFNPSNSTVNKISSGYEDAFVLKLNSVGDFQWVKTAGGTGPDVSHALSLDNSANVYVTGVYDSSASFDLLAAGSSLTSNGLYDAFVWKLSATGSFTWVKTIGGPSYDYGYEIEVDGIGNSYIGGKVKSGADFDPGTPVVTGTNNGGYDAYVLKLDASGNYQWAHTYGGTGEDIVKEITLSSTNGLYVSGSFNSTVDFDPSGTVLSLSALSSNELFIQKLDISGNFSWAKAFTGCWSVSSTYLKETSSNNIIFCGAFSGTADFDPNAGTQLVVSTGSRDIFIEEIDSSGNYIDVFTMGGSSDDRGISLVVNSTDEVFITGVASSNFDFNPNGTPLTPGYYTDYTAKYILCSPTTGIDMQTACDSFVWIDGNTYTSSNNTATHTLINSAGCDSVVTLDLTVNSSSTGTDMQIACDAYTWIDGITYTASNNTATYTLVNAVGCDSIVTLDLTVNSSSTGTDIQTACDSYTWIDGNTYTSSNNTATHTLVNTVGCDSIVTLNLTISLSTVSTDTQTACDSYTWIDGVTYTSSNNSATVTLVNVAGCDSVITLDLTINSSNTGTDIQTACESYTWIDGNTYITSNNSATHTLINVVGCDSVVTLNLTIVTPDITVTQVGNVLTSNATGAAYQWLDCNNSNAIVEGETSQVFTAGNGSYALEVTQNGCVDTSACYLVTGVGLPENNFNEKLKLYPNPNSGNFIVDLMSISPKTDIRVLDLNGKILLETTVKNKQFVNLNFEGPEGVYLVQIITETSSSTIKLIMR